MTTSESPPLACVVDAIPAEERSAHFALIQRLFRSPRGTLPIEDGYAFTFAPELLMDVARFVENERRCCPFLTFTLEQGADGGDLTLRLVGPVGTRRLLEAELPL